MLRSRIKSGKAVGTPGPWRRWSIWLAAALVLGFALIGFAHDHASDEAPAHCGLCHVQQTPIGTIAVASLPFEAAPQGRITSSDRQPARSVEPYRTPPSRGPPIP